MKLTKKMAPTTTTVLAVLLLATHLSVCQSERTHNPWTRSPKVSWKCIVSFFSCCCCCFWASHSYLIPSSRLKTAMASAKITCGGNPVTQAYRRWRRLTWSKTTSWPIKSSTSMPGMCSTNSSFSFSCARSQLTCHSSPQNKTKRKTNSLETPRCSKKCCFATCAKLCMLAAWFRKDMIMKWLVCKYNFEQPFFVLRLNLD